MQPGFFIVVFEFSVTSEHKDKYFDLALDLKPHLEKIEGFISVERFQSITDPDKFISISYWRNEESLVKWRNAGAHRLAQGIGMNQVFQDYNLRVAKVIRAYDKNCRNQAPRDSNDYHRR
jgi:heme-degrading monooxygenase HmoA